MNSTSIEFNIVLLCCLQVAVLTAVNQTVCVLLMTVKVITYKQTTKTVLFLDVDNVKSDTTCPVGSHHAVSQGLDARLTVRLLDMEVATHTAVGLVARLVAQNV